MPLNVHPESPETPIDQHLPHPALLIVNGNNRAGQETFGVAITALREAGIEVKEAVLAKDKGETEQRLKEESARCAAKWRRKLA